MGTIQRFITEKKLDVWDNSLYVCRMYYVVYTQLYYKSRLSKSVHTADSIEGQIYSLSVAVRTLFERRAVCESVVYNCTMYLKIFRLCAGVGIYIFIYLVLDFQIHLGGRDIFMYIFIQLCYVHLPLPQLPTHIIWPQS